MEKILLIDGNRDMYTPKKIKMLLEQRTGNRITVKKNTGSMKYYVTFIIKAPHIFAESLRLEIKDMFPSKNKTAGCFVSESQIDIFNAYLNY